LGSEVTERSAAGGLEWKGRLPATATSVVPAKTKVLRFARDDQHYRDDTLEN